MMINIFSLFFSLAEEREELELLNNFRQKQLELQHHQLLEELERLKTARETTSPNFSNSHLFRTGQEQFSSPDANFKHLM